MHDRRSASVPPNQFRTVPGPRDVRVAAERLAFAAALLIAGCAAFLLASPAVDDAYIVFRYVDRLLDGRGLTFNDGERVEGFTSLSWTLLLAGAAAVTGADLPALAILVNAAFVVLTVVVFRQLLDELPVGRAVKALALLTLAGSALYIEVAQLGLEFALFAFVLTWFVRELFRLWRAPTRARAAGTGLLGALLFTTRPEMLPVPPALLALGVLSRERAGRVRPAVTAAACWAAGVAAVTVWRVLYFGDLLPTSAIAKASAPGSPEWWPNLRWAVRTGIEYFAHGYARAPALALGIAGGAALLWRGEARPFAAALLLPIAVATLVTLQNGGDWMPFWRFIHMYAPLHVALLALAIGALAWRRPAAGLAAGLAVLAVHVATGAAQASLDGPAFTRRDEGTVLDLYERIGGALERAWAPGDAVMPEAIGRIGFTAPALPIHDPAGLTDRTLAHDPAAARTMFGRTNWRYSLGREPAVIVLHYWGHERDWREDVPEFDAEAAYELHVVPPLAHSRDGRSAYVLVRRDRAARYRSALEGLGGRRIAFDDASSPPE